MLNNHLCEIMHRNLNFLFDIRYYFIVCNPSSVILRLSSVVFRLSPQLTILQLLTQRGLYRNNRYKPQTDTNFYINLVRYEKYDVI